MLTPDSRINALVLKWANNIEGTWGDVTRDLVEFREQVEHDLLNDLNNELDVKQEEELPEAI